MVSQSENVDVVHHILYRWIYHNNIVFRICLKLICLNINSLSLSIIDMQDPPVYVLTEADLYLLKHIYPEDYQVSIRDGYVALRTFILQNGRYPSEFSDRGKKRPISDPERRLAIFVNTNKRGWSSPAMKQLLEKCPQWSWYPHQLNQV